MGREGVGWRVLAMVLAAQAAGELLTVTVNVPAGTRLVQGRKVLTSIGLGRKEIASDWTQLMPVGRSRPLSPAVAPQWEIDVCSSVVALQRRACVLPGVVYFLVADSSSTPSRRTTLPELVVPLEAGDDLDLRVEAVDGRAATMAWRVADSATGNATTQWFLEEIRAIVPGVVASLDGGGSGQVLVARLGQNLVSTATVLLRPSTEYRFTVMHEAVGQRVRIAQVTFLSGQVPQTFPPEVVNPRAFLTPTTVSALVEFRPWTGLVPGIVFEYTDDIANLTQRALFLLTADSTIVQVDSGTGRLSLRVFVLNLLPNTPYRYRVAGGDALNRTSTPFSGEVSARTLRAVQARPPAPVSEVVNDTLVRVRPNNAARDYGRTVHTVFSVAAEGEGGIRLVAAAGAFEVTCAGRCVDGILLPVARLRGLARVSVAQAVLNDVGLSARSDVSRLALPPSPAAPPSRSLLIGLVVGSALLVGGGAVAAWLVVQAGQSRQRLVELVRPEPIAGVEVDPACLAYDAFVNTGSSARIYRGHLRPPPASPGPGYSEPLALGVVAIKRSCRRDTTADLRAFVQEVVFLNELRHSNVLRLHAAVTQSLPMAIVTEFCHGGSLLEYVKTHVVAAEQLARWTVSAASALAYVHSMSILHRDVAARNYLVTLACELRLADFGLSCRCDPNASVYLGSAEHDHLIPVRWASPAVLARRRFSVASDTWSLCVTLYEMYSAGSRPYAGVVDLDALARAVVQRRAMLAVAPAMPIATRQRVTEVMSRPDDPWARPELFLSDNPPAASEPERSLPLPVFRGSRV